MDEKKGLYFSLSYVWGDPGKGENIIVNDEMFTITKNLAEFLRGLYRLQERDPKYAFDTLPVWADAICINQSDLEERSSQVQLMQAIYTHSQCTIAWLGPQDSSSGSTIQFLQNFTKSASMSKDGKRIWLPRDSSDIFIRRTSNGTMDFQYMKQWMRSIDLLFEREYWQRTWTFQEMVLPQEVIVLCGDDACSITDILTFHSWAYNIKSQPRPNFIDETLWDIIAVRCGLELQNIRKLSTILIAKEIKGPQGDKDDLIRRRETGWQMSLLESRRKATNPRDKVYGFLGISELQSIIPDYSKSVEKVFREFAVAGIELHLTRWVLNNSGVSLKKVPENTDGPKEIPSWVPDLESSRIPLSAFDNIFRASGDSFFDEVGGATTRDDTLICPALKFDEITSVLYDREEEGSNLEDFFRKLFSDNKGKDYTTGNSRLQALFKVLMMDCVGDALNPKLFQKYVGAFMFQVLRYEPKASFQKELMPLMADFYRSEWNSTHREWGNDHYYYSRLYMDNATLMERFRSMVIFETKNGYLGRSASRPTPGDQVYIMSGCDYPVLLRRYDSHFTNVGICFVKGVMYGEAVQTAIDEKRSIETLEIQ